LGLLDVVTVANKHMPDRHSTMPCAPPSFTVHDTIPEIAIVPALETDDEVWSRIVADAAALDERRNADVSGTRDEKLSNETLPAPDAGSSESHDDTPAYVRMVRRHLAARDVDVSLTNHWWHNPANIAALLTYLNDQEGGLELCIAIQIVEKPWNWDAEYDEMLDAKRNRDAGKRPTLFDEVQSEEYAERRGYP
jgi:hypothetical protein